LQIILSDMLINFWVAFI